MDKAWNRIKQAWEENPLVVIAVGAFAATAAAKVIDASSKRRYSYAWQREVDRRNRMGR